MKQNLLRIPRAAFEAWAQQEAPTAGAAARVPARDRRLCGLWLAWRRTTMGQRQAEIARRTGLASRSLKLLELGVATRQIAPDEVWEHLCFILSDAQYTLDRIAGIVSMALGQSVLGGFVIIEQVELDLEGLWSDAADEGLSGPEFADLELPFPVGLTLPPPAAPSSDAIALLRHSIFAGLHETYLDLLAGKLVEEVFEPGELIFRQGSRGDALYIIAGGQVQIAIETQSGQEIPVELPGRGKVFGELALLDGHQRSATVRALTQTRAYALQRAAFEQVSGDHPDIYRVIAAELARRLRKANAYVEFFSDNSPQKRFALALSYLARTYGQELGLEVRFDLATVQDELARLPGSSSDSVSGELAALVELGIITLTAPQATLNLQKITKYLP